MQDSRQQHLQHLVSQARKTEKKKEKKYLPKKYHTPDNIGEKWQLDVKYVPQKCYVGDIISIEGLDMDLKIVKEEE